MVDWGNFEGSNKGPDNRDDKGCKNKLSNAKTMLVQSNISKIFLQSWALDREMFKTAWLQSCR